MKKILYRNILIDCLIFFFIALISSSVIIWVFQAVNYLDLIVDEGRDYQIYFKYTLLSFPKIISKLIPFVIFFSIFYVISKYEINNELMILWNIGINKIEFVNFFLKFSFIILITQLFLTIYLVPASLEESRSIIRDSEINIEEGFFKSKKFNDTIKGLIIYVEEKDKNNFLRNVYIKKQINNNSFQITFAKQGKFITRGNDTILELYDGRTINENNGKDSYFTFSKSDFNFTNNETRIFKINKVQEIPTIDYFICLNKILNFGLKITNQINENSKYKCSIQGLKDIYGEGFKKIAAEQMSLIEQISGHIEHINKGITQMIEARKKANTLDDMEACAFAYCNEVKPFFDDIRYHCDKLELLVDDELWPLVKYRELLFTR